MRLLVQQMDCGFKIAVVLRLWPGHHLYWRVRNPFRRNLSNEAWVRGDPKWRWPVSLWAKG